MRTRKEILDYLGIEENEVCEEITADLLRTALSIEKKYEKLLRSPFDIVGYGLDGDYYENRLEDATWKLEELNGIVVYAFIPTKIIDTENDIQYKLGAIDTNGKGYYFNENCDSVVYGSDYWKDELARHKRDKAYEITEYAINGLFLLDEQDLDFWQEQEKVIIDSNINKIIDKWSI